VAAVVVADYFIMVERFLMGECECGVREWPTKKDSKKIILSLLILFIVAFLFMLGASLS